MKMIVKTIIFLSFLSLHIVLKIKKHKILHNILIFSLWSDTLYWNEMKLEDATWE